MLTDDRVMEAGQDIDRVRRLLVFDSVGMTSLDDSRPVVAIAFHRRTVPDEQLVITLGAAQPIASDQEMTEQEAAAAAWHTLLPLIEAALSSHIDSTREAV